MRYFTIESFSKEAIQTISDKMEHIYVVFKAEDAKQDKFNKYNAHPLMFVVKKSDGTDILEYDIICELFQDTVSISVGKPSHITNGIACLKIDAGYEYSEKLECEFHPRKYIGVSNSVIEKANKIHKENAEKAKPEILDI